jgi:hypothetical protein
LIWSKLSSIEFISSDKLIAGFHGGDIQYVELRLGSESIKDYTVLKFGKSRITKIKAVVKKPANSRNQRTNLRTLKSQNTGNDTIIEDSDAESGFEISPSRRYQGSTSFEKLDISIGNQISAHQAGNSNQVNNFDIDGT